MSARHSDDPRLPQARAAQVRSYLLERGWEQQRYPRPELWVFGGKQDDDGKRVIQVVPSSEKLKDFPARLEELVEALSVMEDRPRAEVLTDILSYLDAAPGPTNGSPQAVEAKGRASRTPRPAP